MPMQRKNFIGFRDRVLLHLLQFEKDVYENIHGGEVDGIDRDFLAFLTQEGIAQGVGTKQSTIYKELQALKEPSLEGEESLIQMIDKARIPGRERACAIYYLTPYGRDIATQKESYLENKNLELSNLSDTDPSEKVIKIGDLVTQLITNGHESKPIPALLRIANNTSAEGKIQWDELITSTMVDIEAEKKKDLLTPINKASHEDVSHEVTSQKIPPNKIPSLEIENPYFNRTAIKDPKYFFGRHEEILYIMSLLGNSQSCSIVGPRRIGKSSLINYISNQNVMKKYSLNPDDYLFVSIDLEGLGDLTQSEFFYMIVEELRNRTTEGEIRKQMEKLLEKEKIKFLDLKNIIKNINEIGKRLVFLFDEFELITTNKNLDSNFFSGLRNLANSFDVSYITASYLPLLELTLSQETLGSPFFNFFTQIELDFLDEDSAQRLIITPAKEYNISLPENIIGYIKNTAGPHPFFIQILGYHVFNWLKDKGAVSNDGLSEITKKFMDEGKAHFQYFYNKLSNEEKSILLAQQDGVELSAQPNNYHELIQNLKMKKLLIEDSDGLRLFSNAFGEFISKIEINKKTYGDKLEVSKLTSESSKDSERLDGFESLSQKKLDEMGSKESVFVQWGNNYISNEEEPKESLKIFNELTNKNISGLIITRIPPDQAQEKWGLSNSKHIWLCSRQGKNNLTPALEKILHEIFIFIKHNKRSVVLLDGMEYIVNNNNFLKSLNLLDNIKEIIAVNKSIFIFPVSSAIFTGKEMALLKKNCVEIPNGSAFDLSKLKN